jgi:hypothetical protein
MRLNMTSHATIISDDEHFMSNIYMRCNDLLQVANAIVYHKMHEKNRLREQADYSSFTRVIVLKIAS